MAICKLHLRSARFEYIINNMRKRSGFTLFETIITVALLSVLAGSFGGFAVSIFSTRSLLQGMHEVDENSRFAIGVISQTIRNATAVNGGASIFDSDPGVLSLSMANPADNPTVFRLDQDNGILTMQQGASQSIAITSNEVQVSRLLFSLLSAAGEPEHIRMIIEAQTSAQDDSYGSFVHTFQAAVSLRQ